MPYLPDSQSSTDSSHHTKKQRYKGAPSHPVQQNHNKDKQKTLIHEAEKLKKETQAYKTRRNQPYILLNSLAEWKDENGLIKFANREIGSYCIVLDTSLGAKTQYCFSTKLFRQSLSIDKLKMKLDSSRSPMERGIIRLKDLGCSWKAEHIPITISPSGYVMELPLTENAEIHPEITGFIYIRKPINDPPESLQMVIGMEHACNSTLITDNSQSLVEHFMVRQAPEGGETLLRNIFILFLLLSFVKLCSFGKKLYFSRKSSAQLVSEKN